MSASIEGLDTYFQCIGALTLLGGFQALQMSLFRMAGSPGERDPNSRLNKTSEMQLLTAEWNPVGICLMLALILRRDNSTFATLFAVAFTAGRFLFWFRLYAPQATRHALDYLSMILTYLATFVLGFRLVNLL